MGEERCRGPSRNMNISKRAVHAGQASLGVPCVAFPSATQNEIDEHDARQLVGNGCYCVSGANSYTSGSRGFVPGCEIRSAWVKRTQLSPDSDEPERGLCGAIVKPSTASLRYNELDSRELRQYGRQNGFVNCVVGANRAGFTLMPWCTRAYLYSRPKTQRFPAKAAEPPPAVCPFL